LTKAGEDVKFQPYPVGYGVLREDTEC